MSGTPSESKREKRERKKEKKLKTQIAEIAGSVSESQQDSQGETPSEVATTNGSHDAHSKSEKSETGEEKNNEIEIDLNASVPLSKKRQRLLKKGKLDLEKLARKNPPPKPATESGESESAPSKSPFGVWIGNLAYDTSKEDLVRFIVAKTKANAASSEDSEDTPCPPVEEKDISRVNLPKKSNKIKGFAYIDLPSSKHVDSVVALSESQLNGRNLLIKNASSFEGRPEEHANKPLSKNPPSRILFVGNLSFDTTEDLLEEHFRHCGDIVKIRMATFEDTGKCKGFAFIDFVNDEGPTTALKSKLAKNFINRPLRLEYGEDRSKRNPKKRSHEDAENNSESHEAPSTSPAPRPTVSRDRVATRPLKKNTERSHSGTDKRMKSSVALATAQRASAAIVPSQGKKVKFD